MHLTIALLLFVLVPPGTGSRLQLHTTFGLEVSAPPPPYFGGCSPRDNMGETAESFIGRCCKGSIREVFPSEYLNRTLDDIQGACKVGSRRDCEDGDEPSLESARKARTAWKLLNRSEYRK